MALLRLVCLCFFAVVAHGESSGYSVSGRSSAGPYELTISGVGQQLADGGYSQWKVEGRVNGANVSSTISDSEFRSGYGARGLVVRKSDLESMKYRGNPIDGVMNSGRSLGVAAAQSYANRVAPKEYQLPPTRNKGTVIVGGDAGTHALQTAKEIGAEMFRAMVARKAYERDKAASLGFDSVSKYKSFLGQNASKIRAAAKAGSDDPLGEVVAQRDAAKAEREEISARANAEAHRILDLGSVEDRIAAAAGTSDEQERYLNSMGVKSAVQHNASIRKSMEALKARQQADADARNPVMRIRRMRETLIGAVQAAVAKGDKMVVSDYEPMVLVINDATKLQDSFRGLTRQPQLRSGSPEIRDALNRHIEVIIGRRLPVALPISQVNLDETLAVLDSLEIVAGMDLTF